MSIRDTVEQAIKTKKRLLIKYNNDILEREVEPYAIFESTADKIDLFSLQIRNPAKPLVKIEPRNFTLQNLKSARLGVSFKPDPLVKLIAVV